MPTTVTWIFDTGVFFKVACESALGIKAPPREGNQAPALISIVFSVVTLEAFLNEITEFASDDFLDIPEAVVALGEFLVDAERSQASLESKFAVGNWILAGKRIDRGVQPYQDFFLLMRLRNDLVHFKANDRFEEGVPQGQVHQNLINRFKGKNILAETSDVDSRSWTQLVKTKAVAEWSCKTAGQMIVDFCNKIPPSDFRSSLDPFVSIFDPKKLFPPP